MSVLQGTQIHRPRSHRAEVDDWYEEAVDLSKWGQPHDPKNPKAKLDPDDQKIGYLVNQTVQVLYMSCLSRAFCLIAPLRLQQTIRGVLNIFCIPLYACLHCIICAHACSRLLYARFFVLKHAQLYRTKPCRHFFHRSGFSGGVQMHILAYAML